MKGGHVKEHFQLTLEIREGEAIRRVAQGALADDEFPLGELEEEALQGLIETLAPSASSGAGTPS